MQQRDLLKDQIEQLGKVLAKLLADFFALKSKGNVSLGIEQTNDQFISKVDIDIEAMAGMSEKELNDYLDSRLLTVPHLELLAKYLYEVGLEKKRSSGHANGLRYFNAAKALLDYADRTSATFSFERKGFWEEICEAEKES